MFGQTTRAKRGFTIVAITAALALAGGGGAALAWAHSGGHHGHDGGNDAALAHHRDHLAALLTKVGVSDAQKGQIHELLAPAFGEMQAARRAHHEAFRQLHDVLLAPSVDRARLESLRADQIRALDEASKRFVTAMSDAAEVLTPEQRAAFAKEVAQHHQ